MQWCMLYSHKDNVDRVVPIKSTQKRADMNKPHQECWSCGQTHDITNKEACPAYGKECKKCHKKHHFASRCWSKRPGSQRVQAVDIEEDEEVFPMEVAAVEHN